MLLEAAEAVRPQLPPRLRQPHLPQSRERLHVEGGRGAAGAGTPGSAFSRPTDVAWDRAGNIFIADGIGTNNRIAKFDKDGSF